jgi:signal peptidase
MLISCQFRYGILVVGSGSMTGSIDMGDAVIYERYDEQIIQEKEVIIFAYNGIQTIHRVTNIKSVNGEVRYYTQGDANPTPDTGYRTDADIFGIVKLRVRYFGYPTLWLRDLFAD